MPHVALHDTRPGTQLAAQGTPSAVELKEVLVESPWPKLGWPRPAQGTPLSWGHIPKSQSTPLHPGLQKQFAEVGWTAKSALV